MTNDLEQRLARLEQKVREVEDLEEIKNLMYEYGYAFDEDRIDDFVNCFTEDCVGEYSPFTKSFAKRSEISEFARGVKGVHPLLTSTFHVTVSPIIKVDGNQATGRWNWMNPCTLETVPGKPISAWQYGVYECKYRKEAEGWKISHVKVTYLAAFELLKGWANHPMLIVGGVDSIAQT